MNDLQKLSSALLKRIKSVNASETVRQDIGEKVYADEPIGAADKAGIILTPPRYRQMRSLALNNCINNDSDAKLFYAQGRFMEDFEDDFAYEGEFSRYFPTYQCMTIQQLRGYFTWRTKLRRGNVEPTNLSYAFVYIYELINQIGVSSPEDGFYKLKSFWEAYGALDNRINHYMRIWLTDYAVYYNIDKSLLEGFSDISFEQRVLMLLNYNAHTPGEVFEALNSLSSYNMENSKLYKAYPEDVAQVVYGVFGRLAEYYKKNRKNDICERFFGKIYSNPYNIFNSAIFFVRRRIQDTVYEINSINRYICKDGKWTCERLFCYKGKNKQVGDLMRAVDYIMRHRYGINSSLKADNLTKLYKEIIVKAIDEFQIEKQKSIKIEINIDLSRLQGIRAAATETQLKLLEDVQEEAGTSIETQLARPEPVHSGLTNTEIEFLRCLLDGRPFRDLVYKSGVMTSVIMDSINEKLFDDFMDTVLTGDEDNPEIIEDYLPRLKGFV